MCTSDCQYVKLWLADNAGTTNVNVSRKNENIEKITTLAISSDDGLMKYLLPFSRWLNIP